MVKKVKTAELFECKNIYLEEFFEESEFPWELLPRIKEIIEKIVSRNKDKITEICEGVFVFEGVEIASSAKIEPPCVIFSGSVIRQGAYIRGNAIIGENCVVGNSSELKNCILLDKVSVPHYNYIGDSILGSHSHMGAGSICSNLKSDKSSVVIHAERDYPTSLRKVGAFVGDFAEIGCGCVLNPGTVIGKGTSIYPLVSLRGVFPEECIVKSDKIIVKKL